MPTRRNSEIAGPRFGRGPALFAALIALAICAAPLPASAATNPGELYAFGLNRFGQLGNATNNGTNNPNPTPTLVGLPGASGPVTQVAAGYEHGLALASTGQLYAFGSNLYGELGIATNSGTSNPNPTPALVGLPGASGPVTQVTAGGEHSLALASSGQLYAFGYNYLGELGSVTNSGTTNPNPTPTPVGLPGASGPVTQIAGGEYHSLALTSTGQLYAFGSNENGELGIATNSGTSNPNPTPTLVGLPGASGPVTQIAGGGYHSLALTSSGQLYAFGLNRYGQLGIATNSGTTNPNPTPTLVTLPGASGPVTQVAAGGYHSLALTSSGQLYSFGRNYYGELGSATNNGTNNPNPTPTLVTLPGASGPVTQIAGGADHSLALTSSGQLYAFGANYYGQLGSATNNGTNNPNPIPVPVDLGAGTTIDTMVSGVQADHTLVVVANLAVASSSLPSGRIGVPYRATAAAAGGTAPYAWQASGLPAGLSIDPGSGQIGGTPTVVGTGQVTLSVSDRYGIVAQSATIALTIAPVRRGRAFAARIAPVKGGKALLRLRCRGGGRCRGVVKLIARVRLRRGVKRPARGSAARRTRRVLIGRTRFSIAAGRTRVIRVKLKRKGKKLLRRARRHRLKVKLKGRGVKPRTVVLKQVHRRRRKH